MGAGGQRSKAGIQILPPHPGRKEAAPGRGVEVETDDRRNRANHVACRGELKCGGGNGKSASRIWSASSAPTWNWKPKNSRIPASLPSRRAMPPSALLATQPRLKKKCGRSGH